MPQLPLFDRVPEKVQERQSVASGSQHLNDVEYYKKAIQTQQDKMQEA